MYFDPWSWPAIYFTIGCGMAVIMSSPIFALLTIFVPVYRPQTKYPQAAILGLIWFWPIFFPIIALVSIKNVIKQRRALRYIRKTVNAHIKAGTWY